MSTWNKNEVKKYFVDVSARVAQVVFTLMVITPFIANIFNWGIFVIGLSLFVFSVVLGTIIAGLVEEGR
jgi:hypothetical protein